MTGIRWTPEAASRLEEIFEYIALDSPSAALKVATGIRAKALTLEAFPERGFRHRSRHGREVRILLYGHYRIVYHLVNEVVEILGIYHGAMDLDRVLGAPS